MQLDTCYSESAVYLNIIGQVVSAKHNIIVQGRSSSHSMILSVCCYLSPLLHTYGWSIRELLWLQVWGQTKWLEFLVWELLSFFVHSSVLFGSMHTYGWSKGVCCYGYMFGVVIIAISLFWTLFCFTL